MKTIDVRLSDKEIALLKSIVGKRIVEIKHDAFIFTNTSAQAVQINCEGETVFVYNFAEENDYYGTEEDVAVLSIEKECYPAVKEKNFISMPIDAVIQKILVVQEEQQLTEEGKEIYDVKLTRGIIFDLGDHQVSFEKAVWFSEDIIVRKGYELINKFLSTEELCKKDNWQENMEMQCSRTIDLIK